MSREWRSWRGQREEEESWLAPDLTGKHGEIISGPGEDEVSSPLAGTREISGCDGFETSRARAQELGGFWAAIGLSCFSEFLKGQPTSKIHDS